VSKLQIHVLVFLVLAFEPALIWTSLAKDNTAVFLALIPEKGPFRENFLRFEEKVENNFVGNIELSLLLEGQVGTEENMMASVRRGRAQIAMLTVPGTAAAIPEMALLMAPYLFDTYKEADFVLDNFIQQPARDLFAEKGLHFIQWIDSGWHIVFSRFPVSTPSDVLNVRMRAAGGEAARFFFEAINADVVPLPFNDLIPGLETGLVDGGATNTAMYRTVGIYEMAPHLTMTNHSINPGVIMANKDWFDNLSATNQKVVEEGLSSSDYLREVVREGDAIHREFLKERGIEVRELSKSERAVWKRLTEPTHKRLIGALGGRSQTIYDVIQEGKAAFALKQGIPR